MLYLLTLPNNVSFGGSWRNYTGRALSRGETNFLFCFSSIVLMMAKMLLEAAGMHVAEVVTETKEEEADGEIKKKIIADAEKMLKDYQTIEGILKKHGV